MLPCIRQVLRILSQWQPKWRNKIKESEIEGRIATRLPRFSASCQDIARQLITRWQELPEDYEIPRLDSVSPLALLIF